MFTIKKATIEDIQALEKMKEHRTKRSEDYTTRENTLKKKQQEESKYKATFRDAVWERILKPNEADFQEAFSGFRNNKERFRDEVLRRYAISHTSSEARDSLLLRAKTLFAQKPEKCAIISFSIDDVVDRLAEIETSTIWGKVIVGNKDLPIGRLIDVLDNAKRIGITGHVRPDGDCLGSCTALYTYLTEQMKNIELSLFLERVPEDFMYLSNVDKIITDYPDLLQEVICSV